jgi:hypothetical protein
MTVNVRDYSRSAAARGWGAGWPSCSGARNNIVTITFARSGVRISVHRRIAELVLLLADATEARGYLAKKGQTGAYNCRAIGGTSVASNHSWGLACDWNWQDNPYTTTGRRSMPDWMPALWSRYGFGWGGWYTGAKKDFMHLEFMGTPADADALTALARAQLGSASRPPIAPAVPQPREDDPMAIIPIRTDAQGRFHETAMVEAGGGSDYGAHAAITCGSTWGRSVVTITALNHLHTPLYGWANVQIDDNGFYAQGLPDGTRIVTIEGVVEHVSDQLDEAGNIIQPATRLAVGVHTKAAA